MAKVAVHFGTEIVKILPLGTIRPGREIGKENNPNTRFMLVDCPDCEVAPRWVSVHSLKGRTQVPCSGCNSKRAGRRREFNH